MYKIIGCTFIALSLTMIAFSQCKGYVPVSHPTYRIYRATRPAYFWTLIGGYATVCLAGMAVVFY